MTPITRRRLLASAGIGAAGVGLGAGGYLVGHDAGRSRQTSGTGSVPFYGEHQAGIATAGPGPPPLRRLRPDDRSAARSCAS